MNPEKQSTTESQRHGESQFNRDIQDKRDEIMPALILYVCILSTRFIPVNSFVRFSPCLRASVVQGRYWVNTPELTIRDGAQGLMEGGDIRLGGRKTGTDPNRAHRVGSDGPVGVRCTVETDPNRDAELVVKTVADL